MLKHKQSYHLISITILFLVFYTSQIKPLFKKVVTQGVKKVESFLKTQGRKINDLDENGETLVMHAARLKKLDVVEYLVKKNANLTLKNQQDEDALMLALDIGDKPTETLPIVQCLIVQGNVKAHGQNKNKETHILKALKTMKKDGVEILISIVQKNNNNPENNPENIMDIEDELLSIIKLLIHEGDANNIDAEDSTKDTAFIITCRRGYLHIGKLLIDKGVNVNKENSNGDTAPLLLLITNYGGEPDFYKYLVENRHIEWSPKCAHKALRILIGKKKSKVVKEILADKNIPIPINDKNQSGETIVLQSINTIKDETALLSILQLAVKRGADLTIGNQYNPGVNPLLRAYAKNFLKVVNYLEQTLKSQHLDFKQHFKSNILTVVATNINSFKTIESLLKAANLTSDDWKSKELNKLVGLIIKKGEYDVLNLITNTYKTNLPYPTGNTKEILARDFYDCYLPRFSKEEKLGFTDYLQEGNVPGLHQEQAKILKLLLERNKIPLIAQDGSTTEEAKKILFTSCATGNIYLIDYLLKQKIDITIKNQNQENSVMIASSYGHPKVVKKLIETGKFKINDHNKNGMTLLMFIAQASRREEYIYYSQEKKEKSKEEEFLLVKYLVEQKKAKPELKNIDSKTAYIFAKEKLSSLYDEEIINPKLIDYLNPEKSNTQKKEKKNSQNNHQEYKDDPVNSPPQTTNKKLPENNDNTITNSPENNRQIPKVINVNNKTVTQEIKEDLKSSKDENQLNSNITQNNNDLTHKNQPTHHLTNSSTPLDKINHPLKERNNSNKPSTLHILQILGITLILLPILIALPYYYFTKRKKLQSTNKIEKG